MSRGTRIRIGKLVVSGGNAQTIQRAIEKNLAGHAIAPRTIPAIATAVAQAVTKKKEGR
jgi:cobalamin biosynthesis protein CbiG